MHDRLGEIKGAGFGVILLNNENAQQTVDAINGVKPSGNITRGLYYRGIE